MCQLYNLLGPWKGPFTDNACLHDKSAHSPPRSCAWQAAHLVYMELVTCGVLQSACADLSLVACKR